MTPDELLELITHRVEVIGAHLDAGMAVALTDAERRVGDLVRDGQPHLRAFTVRAILRKQLLTAPLGDWQLGGDPKLMGQLRLIDPAHDLTLRVLKERRRTYPGGVPIAGHNAARRNAWRQPKLFGEDEVVVEGARSLLLLWDLINPDAIDDGYTLRVVHTLEPGVHGQPVPCDLSIEIKPGGSLFGSLRFRGGDDPEDFFASDDVEGFEG